MKTYLPKLQAQMAVQQESREVNVKNTKKEDIPRLLEQHGPQIDRTNTQQHSNKC